MMADARTTSVKIAKNEAMRAVASNGGLAVGGVGARWAAAAQSEPPPRPGGGRRRARARDLGLLQHGSAACRGRSHRDMSLVLGSRIGVPAGDARRLRALDAGAAIAVLARHAVAAQDARVRTAERRVRRWVIPVWSSRPASAGCSLLDLSANGQPGNRYLALYHQGHLWFGMLTRSASLHSCASRSDARSAWTLSVFDGLASSVGSAARRCRGRGSVSGADAGAGRCRRVAVTQLTPAHVRNRPPVAHRGRGLVLLHARHAVHRAPRRVAEARSPRSSGTCWPLLFVVIVLIGAMLITHDMGPLLIAATPPAPSSPRRSPCGGTSGVARLASALRCSRSCCSSAWIAGDDRRRCSDSVRSTMSRRRGSRISPRRSRRPTTSSRWSPGFSAPRRRRDSDRARSRGAASAQAGACAGVPAQIQSDYTFTRAGRRVRLDGGLGADDRLLPLWLHALIRTPWHAQRAASRASSGIGGRMGNDHQAFVSWLLRRVGRARALPARGDRRGQPRRDSAHRRHLPVRELRHDVAAW